MGQKQVDNLLNEKHVWCNCTQKLFMSFKDQFTYFPAKWKSTAHDSKKLKLTLKHHQTLKESQAAEIFSFWCLWLNVKTGFILSSLSANIHICYKRCIQYTMYHVQLFQFCFHGLYLYISLFPVFPFRPF